MRVLIACEQSGVVRRAFRANGHDAYSCDIEPAGDGSPYHIRGDARPLLREPWDLVIAHPPCQYLANSGAKWLYRDGQRGNGPDAERWEAMRQAAAFFRECMAANAPRVAVENPVMHKHGAALVGARACQFVQPWMFGHRETKQTGFHLKNLPPLRPTDIVGPPRSAEERRAFAVVHYRPDSKGRAKLRSITYTGIARAMVEQWGNP